MGIDNHLKVIKEGVFGRDVRQAIHDGIQQVYEDATVEHGNTDMEVAKARGEFGTLADHLKNIHAKLSSKSDESEIKQMLQNMASASPKGTFANIAALRQAKPNGDTGTYITTDNKNWNYWNGSDWVAGGIYQSSAVSPYDTFAFVAGDKPINFNNSSKIIEITGNNTYLVQGQVYAIVKESVPYPTSSAWIVIDTTTKRIKSAGNPTATDIIVGAIFNPDTTSPKITFNGMYSIDNLQALTNREVIPFSQYSLFTNNANIVFDSKRNVLKFPQTNVIMGSKENWVQAQELQLSGSAGYILFNTANNKFETGAANRQDLINVVGYYHLGRGYVHLNTTTLNMRIKKIACLGDSITEGVNAGGWQWHRYIDQWCKNNGIESTVVNLGIGGTSVCTSSYVTDQLQPFVNRLDTIPSDADVVVIFGGTNDWGNNATLGTISDTGISTFYGAYKHILEWLAINRPNAKVMTMTPLKRYYRGGGSVWVNAQTTPNNKGNLLQDYVRAVKEVSDLYAVPCVDLHNDSGLNPVIETVRTKFIGDGLHPTAEGNKKMYPIILDKMRPLLEYD
ncbi:SGNH/GDSL hydrolase family protein [Streptococcus suis]|uniref:SGNH/GDSL hydrolase family protein n=1 Tax=Streptococcus suis TaxID=1307 RepID=A0A4T2GIY4_STRSU|nr:SGNH/GDSL hydrolase family protein [Streptococcus suis]MBM7270687.1 SGNH/GDSL hydrolase family protein [Streptococcus suis]TIH98173.1 SGNH/GDSL hydrolase family protein [Streptococcus suis]